MKRIAVAATMAVMLGVMMTSAAQAQSRDPKEEQKHTAKEIDTEYERARKATSWSNTPKAINDPWLNVRPGTTGEKK